MRIINIIARCIALVSFLTGTMLFVWYRETNQWFIVDYSLRFILASVLINLAVLTALVVCLIVSKGKQTYLLTLGFVLLNIPIAVLYGRIVYTSLNEAKHIFINGTGSEIKDVQICGCGSAKDIRKLEPGESTKVRFKMDRPCGVNVKFQSKGKSKELIAFGTDRAIEKASWSTFIIDRDMIDQIDDESLRKYKFKQGY